MEEKQATEVLGDAIADDGLYSLGWYLGWTTGDETAILDGIFTAEEIEAVA